MLATLNIDIQAMLVWLTLPFYDFCGFPSVAVNSVLYRPVARLLAHGGHHDFLRGHLIIFLPVPELSHFISFLPSILLTRPTNKLWKS